MEKLIAGLLVIALVFAGGSLFGAWTVSTDPRPDPQQVQKIVATASLYGQALDRFHEPQVGQKYTPPDPLQDNALACSTLKIADDNKPQAFPKDFPNADSFNTMRSWCQKWAWQ